MFDIDEFADSGQLFDNHYKLIRPLNTEGGTADVWLALDNSTVRDKSKLDDAPFLDDSALNKLGLLVAIKIYRPKNALDIEGERRFREEFMIVFNCNHTNLIHPVHFNIFEDTPYLVLPYCQRGSSELMVGNFINDGDIWKFILDVASGINYLHHCNPPIIHQDIKPANVLISDSGNYAITDFGISAKRIRRTTRSNIVNDIVEGEDEYEEKSGTFAYMAPERFYEGSMPSIESDIWAFGATLYELITGQVPFGEDGGLTQPDGKVSLSFGHLNISEDIKRLVCDCLSKNPFERPTSIQLIDAANLRKYTSNKRRKPTNPKVLLSAILALALAGAIGWYLVNHNKSTSSDEIVAPVTTEEQNEQPKSLSPSDLFNEAMTWADATTLDSLQTGLEKLEKLATDKNYVPAIYELAKTYGGEAPDNEMAMNRKELLGIKLGNEDMKYGGDGSYLPRDNRYIDKAIRYYSEIVQLADPDYEEINMKSAFRLGFYYIFLKNDRTRSIEYFKMAQTLARRIHNEEIAQDAEDYIEQINGL